jgi:hypothetical protein
MEIKVEKVKHNFCVWPNFVLWPIFVQPEKTVTDFSQEAFVCRAQDKKGQVDCISKQSLQMVGRFSGFYSFSR